MHAARLKMGSKVVAHLDEQVDRCLWHDEVDDARKAVEESGLSERERCDRLNVVKVDADAFVYMWSWDSLKEPADQMFPGTHVAVERLQKSGRILSARTSGPALRLPERSHDMRYWLVAQEEECPLVPGSEMPPEFLKAAGLS